MDVTLTIEGQTAFLAVNVAAVLENINIIEEKLMDVLVSGATRLEIDFAECEQVSGTFIGKLMAFRNNYTEKNGEVEIVKCSKLVSDLFELIKLDKLIKVHAEG
jgi:ABC-type transporter Mla MlaB component